MSSQTLMTNLSRNTSHTSNSSSCRPASAPAQLILHSSSLHDLSRSSSATQHTRDQFNSLSLTSPPESPQPIRPHSAKSSRLCPRLNRYATAFNQTLYIQQQPVSNPRRRIYNNMDARAKLARRLMYKPPPPQKKRRKKRIPQKKCEKIPQKRNSVVMTTEELIKHYSAAISNIFEWLTKLSGSNYVTIKELQMFNIKAGANPDDAWKDAKYFMEFFDEDDDGQIQAGEWTKAWNNSIRENGLVLVNSLMAMFDGIMADNTPSNKEYKKLMVTFKSLPSGFRKHHSDRRPGFLRAETAQPSLLPASTKKTAVYRRKPNLKRTMSSDTWGEKWGNHRSTSERYELVDVDEFENLQQMMLDQSDKAG